MFYLLKGDYRVWGLLEFYRSSSEDSHISSPMARITTYLPVPLRPYKDPKNIDMGYFMLKSHIAILTTFILVALDSVGFYDFEPGDFPACRIAVGQFRGFRVYALRV